ncbi:actin-related protein 8-like [Oppia nitens]|uniref:actin-related protein 8-like n=1 Tax=Oppia nitens TaxID=1686743 RepID=UPI0023D9B63E|nr:actin-related protein 8-like [Oppia nitens]
MNVMVSETPDSFGQSSTDVVRPPDETTVSPAVVIPEDGAEDKSISADPQQQQSASDIDATKILVINFGSLYLRLGRACDPIPKCVHNVIARRNRSKQLPPREDSLLIAANAVDAELEKCLDNCQKSVTNVLTACRTTSGRPISSTNREVIVDFNRRSKPIVLSANSTANGKHWTQVDNNEDVLIGDDVLYLKPGQPFHIRCPIRRGNLNINDALGGSLTTVIADLETICRKSITKYLEIPVNELNQYKVVLIIPDVYNRNHIKYLIDMLLNDMRFQSCLVIHEAVCATFGAGLSTACVVDVGHQKTSICCIEDGFGSRNSRLTLDYGGSDITQVFHYLLKQLSFPYGCNNNSQLGSLFLQDLKEKWCHLDVNSYTQKEKHFRITIPEQPVLEYKIIVGDESLRAPLAFFYPDMFALTMSSGKRMRILRRNEGHPDDPFDENYLILTKRKYGDNSDNLSQITNDTTGTDINIDDDLDVGCDVITANDKEINSDQQLLSLDQAIIQCIEQCESDDMKNRMFGSILLCGGGLAFNGIDKWLLNCLTKQVGPQFDSQKIEIIIKPKDMDSQIVSWKGAAVLSLLDSAQDLWITGDDWNRLGLKVLREKTSFVF